MNRTLRWLFAITSIAWACIPTGLHGQTVADEVKPEASRGTKILLGALVGAGAGAAWGEYYLGRMKDVPHGPDMLIGAGLGAGVGALIVAVVTGDRRPATEQESRVVVVPVLSLNRPAMHVRIVVP